MDGQSRAPRPSAPSFPSPKHDSRWLAVRDHAFAYSLIFTALFLAHAPLLRLPYFWDEAGYFVPAAYDLLRTGSLIPHSTLSNAHPPLVMLWLAFWWKFSAFTPAVTRIALLLVAALALTGVWRLARFVANDAVAVGTVACTVAYPVFFTQSSMAHLDMMACALTIWGLAMYAERRPMATVAFLVLAPLAKETAIVTPMALFVWEVLCPLLFRAISVHANTPRQSTASVKSQPQNEASQVAERAPLPKALKGHSFSRAAHAPQGRALAPEDLETNSRDSDFCFQHHNWFRTLSFILCWGPILLWLVYHRHKTGYLLGNPEYLRYNLGATITRLRIVLAMLIRVWHLFGYLNLFVLTLLTLYAMSKPALLERDGSERQRIAIPIQLAFAAVIAAHVIVLSFLGGAVLARYMLPVLPLVILLCVSTLRRRLRHWVWCVLGVCAAFVFALFATPPYRVAPEDTLLYRDYVILHKQAETEIARRFPHARVLTAWPASDEMTRPFLGYVSQPLTVVRIENFSQAEIEQAAHVTDQFDIAFLFTTKWQPPHPLWQTLPFGEALQQRFFDYHEDLTPDRAATMLGGRILRYENRNNEWIAIIAIERVENAALR
jgi:hypothetical protein